MEPKQNNMCRNACSNAVGVMKYMKGAILEKGERGYTYLRKIFELVPCLKTDYNWLITDCEAHPKSEGRAVRLAQTNGNAWISGEELYGMVRHDDFQWIWGVLSGFNKAILKEEVLKYEYPYADGYGGFWNKELSIQHPLASVELVAWDGSLTLIISKEESVVGEFRNAFELSEDLECYNKRVWAKVEGTWDESDVYERWLENNQ